MKKTNTAHRHVPAGVGPKQRVSVILILALFLLAFGCTLPVSMLKQALSAPVPPPSAPAPPANSSPGGPNVSAASNTSDTSFASCTSQDCFVTAANACQSSQWTSSDEVATWQYVSTRACVVSKTLVKLNGNESAQMKNLLEGKSMACLYAKGQFDSNLVTSWVAGTGNCNGPLKDAMGELLLFANSS